MAANRNARSRIHNEKGLATIESLPILVIFLVLISYGLGMFGAIHTAILHSMSARAYAYETFSHRTNLNLFRQRRSDNYLGNHGIRFHAVVDYETDGFVASKQPLAFGREIDWAPTGPKASSVDHSERIYQISRARNRKVSISPFWIMVGYGICLNAACGGEEK
jgi:hypothetical protein